MNLPELSWFKWEVDAVKRIVIMLYQASAFHYTFNDQDYQWFDGQVFHIDRELGGGRLD